MRIPPYGLQGGAPAQTYRVTLEREGAVSEVNGKDNLVLRRGDMVTMHSCGGGGSGAAR